MRLVHARSSLPFLLVLAFAAQVSAQTPQEVAHKLFPKTLVLVLEGADGRPSSLGSGFVIGPGVVATNRHVLEGARKGFGKYVGTTQRLEIEGVLAESAEHDLALIKIPGVSVPPVNFGDSDTVEIGETVYAIGSPVGLEGTFSNGIVSGFRSVGEQRLIQITAPISPGRSGGPVTNSKGLVIGVAVATLKDGQNLNFAVPTNYLSQLRANATTVKPLAIAKSDTGKLPLDPSLPIQRCARSGVTVRGPDGWVYCFVGGYRWTEEQIDAYLTSIYKGIYPHPSTPVDPSVSMARPMSAYCEGFEIGNERRCLRSKDTFKDCPTCPEMVVVPPWGSFTMGSPENEPERGVNEDQVSVKIPAPFAVGRYAVTFHEWDACVADGGCNGYKPADGGWGRGKHPVINVNWDDAKAYVTWLSRKTGKTYRLLSEAEREYVTRAGTTTPFWWGSSITPKQANYNSIADPYRGGGSKGDYRAHTVPVDSFEPNPWGLYNVHGNVWEWTEDCWNDSSTGNPGDGRARTTGNCSQRVVRGGSRHSYPRFLRSPSRGGLTTGTRGDEVGFRLARTLKVAPITFAPQ